MKSFIVFHRKKYRYRNGSLIRNRNRALPNRCFRGHDVCGRDTDVLLPDSEGNRPHGSLMVDFIMEC